MKKQTKENEKSSQGAARRPLRVAAIDLGTNSCHLAVTQIAPDGHLEILDTHKETIRLGESLDASNFMSQEVIHRAVDAFKLMKSISEPYQATIRAVATHATRTAVNHAELLKAIEEATGIHVEIIDGPEEGRLSFLGMRCGLSIDRHFSLGVDIGGGSTEFVIGKGNDIRYVSSVKLGTVTGSKRFFGMKTPSPADIKKYKNHLLATLVPILFDTKKYHFSKALASSGTAKALAVLHSQMYNNGNLADPNGYTFSAEDLDKIEKRMVRLADPRKIRSFFGVDQKRAEIILVGTMILNAITKLLDVQEWTVSTYALREGLAMDTYCRMHQVPPKKYIDVRWKSIEALGERLGIDTEYAAFMRDLSLSIYRQIENRYFGNLSAADKLHHAELLQAASYLVECGKFINFPDYHKHSYYIISQSPILGFSEEDKHLIGLISKFSRKKVATSDRARYNEYLRPHLRTVNVLSGCLRLAKALNRTRSGKIKELKVTFVRDKMHVHIKPYARQDLEAELQILQREQKNLAKAFGMDIDYHVKTS